MTITKFKSLVPMPTSMTDCVRNGIIKLIMLPVSIAKNNCTTKRLYGIKYFNRFLKFNLISSSFCSENFCVGSSNNAIPIDLSSVLSEMVCAQHFRNCFFLYFKSPEAGSDI